MTLTFSGQLDDAGSGDRKLGDIFRAYSRRVTGLCRHMLRDDVLAQDAASEVFLRVREGLPGYDASVPMERWLLRIAANHCIDVLRRRQVERRWIAPVEAPEPTASDASPLTVLLVDERRESVEQALAELDETYRIPLVLRYYAGLSYDEIAAELRLEKTQVAGRIFRAKQMLRVSLKERV